MIQDVVAGTSTAETPANARLGTGRGQETGPPVMRRLLMSAALAVRIGAPIVIMPSAHAVPVEPNNCVEQFWMFGLRASTRRICDGPIRPNGSWHRCRLFYAPVYVIPAHTYCFGEMLGVLDLLSTSVGA